MKELYEYYHSDELNSKNTMCPKFMRKLELPDRAEEYRNAEFGIPYNNITNSGSILTIVIEKKDEQNKGLAILIPGFLKTRSGYKDYIPVSLVECIAPEDKPAVEELVKSHLTQVYGEEIRDKPLRFW